MNKLERWTPEEAGLLDEMKSRCLNGGNYKDEKAEEKFKMLCHLEDYAIEFYEGEKEIDNLQKENEILKSALLFIFRDYKVEEIDIEELKNALNELKNLNWGDEE